MNPLCGFGQSSPCMHRVWIGVDSGVPATKQTRHHASIHCDDRRNEVQGTPALAVARECTLLLIQAEVPVHAPCLHSSRFGRPRREAHAVSCQRSTHGIMSDFARGRFGASLVRSFPLESIGIFRPLGFFRPTPRKNIWSNLVLSYLSGVRTLAYRT